MDIEYVARESLASGRLVGQERELAVGRGVFGEVVDDDERVAAAIAEIFGDREAGERGDPLQRGGSGGGGDDKDAALGRSELPRRLDNALNRGRALSDRDIDANHVRALLVDDRVDRDRRLAGGAVADDELALPAPERKERVDHENSGRHRFGDERPIDDRRRGPLDRMERLGGDRLVAVERAAERVDDAAEKSRADGHARDLAGRRDERADADLFAFVEDRRVDRLGLERQGVAHPPALEAQELAEPRLRQAGHLRDPVGDRLDPSDRLGLGLEIDAAQRFALGREPRGPVNAGRGHDGSVPRRCG